MRTFNLTGVGPREEAALLKEPVKLPSKWNPFPYVWTGMQHAAYWVAPANNCVYCWVWRMFFIGMFVGMELMWLFPKIKVW